ncbi:MAG: EAL domain-containing protein [Betaproteobacteria bacterium]|nr:EAL domain-containing protein [Betaproteobacteria bacterium]
MRDDKLEYSIQEVAEKLGVPVQKLRRWDAQGVLVARRTDGGHRRYAREIVDGLAASTLGSTMDRYNDELEHARKALQEKRRIIQLLLESESRYRDLVETSHDLIWTTDSQGRFTYLNGAAYEIFGLKPQELIGRCFFDFEARPSHVSNRRFLSQLKRLGEVKNYTTQLVSVDGHERWVGINARVAHDEAGGVMCIRGTARDITEQQQAALQTEYFATHDPLTGLPNRVSLHKSVERAMHSHEKGAVVFIDLDHFKYVNDNVGHRRGDQMLVAVGGILREVADGLGATVYRLGGDEFAAHIPGALRPQAQDTADALLTRLRQCPIPLPSDDRVVSVTGSAGIALYPFHGNEPNSAFACADIALYQAKDAGRNRVVIYGQDGGDALRTTHRRVIWAKQLREVLDEDRVLLYVQPVIRLNDEEPMHYEVLVRIEDDEGRIVAPQQFIEAAESIGIVQEIDLRVIQKLVDYLSVPTRRGMRSRFFVNLSRLSISDPEWTRRFHALLDQADISRGQIVFEISEAAAMAEVSISKGFIRELKQKGYRFALDNFGAGFSSFYYLRQFDVDYIKIDGSFVRDLTRDDANAIFVKALCDVGQGLSKQVIAKWVETPEVLSRLNEMKVEYAQGFLFNRPFPIEAPETREPAFLKQAASTHH